MMKKHMCMVHTTALLWCAMYSVGYADENSSVHADEDSDTEDTSDDNFTVQTGSGGDEFAFLLEQLQVSTPPANTIFGLGTIAGATDKNIWESRLRYRISDRREPGFEESNPHLHDYVEFVNRYYYKLNHAEHGWNSSVQLDHVSLGLNKYILDDQLYNSWNLLDPSLFSPVPNSFVRIEKVNVTKKIGASKMEFGDTGGVFGRGIALNIRSNKVVDIDTSLRGVKYVGNIGNAEITALTGVSNRQQISRDNPNLNLYQDVGHMVTGAQMYVYGLGSAQVGVHSMVASFGDTTQRGSSGLMRYDQPIDARVSGADVEIFGLVGIDWYAEGDYFEYLSDKMSSNGEVTDGYTGYMSASMYPENAVVLVEAKVMKDCERINLFTSIDNWEVATPPSLEYERMITEDSSAMVNSNDVTAVRVRADYPIKPQVFVPYTSLLVARDNDLTGLHFNVVPETIVHPIVGLQYTEKEKVILLNTGFRVDHRDTNTGVDYGDDMLAHVDGEYSFPIAGGDHLELNVSMWKFWWGKAPTPHNDFVTMQNAIVWKHGDMWNFTWYHDYTTDTQIQSVGNVTDNLYTAGEIKYKPTADTSLKLLAGAYKAGIRCSGGQCRMLPGFNGVELAYSTNF